MVNRTGGSGVVGHSAIATAQPDGYTIGMLTVEISMMHWQGLTELAPKSYTPLALMNDDPPGIQVRSGLALQDREGARRRHQGRACRQVQGLRHRPGRHLASGAGRLDAGDGTCAANQVAWVPSNGAAPAMQDLAAGGLDLTTCSVPEARAIIEAGKARSLAMMAPARNPAFPDVPTLKEAMGIDYATGAWRGIAGPEGPACRMSRPSSPRR